MTIIEYWKEVIVYEERHKTEVGNKFNISKSKYHWRNDHYSIIVCVCDQRNFLKERLLSVLDPTVEWSTVHQLSVPWAWGTVHRLLVSGEASVP